MPLFLTLRILVPFLEHYLVLLLPLFQPLRIIVHFPNTIQYCCLFFIYCESWTLSLGTVEYYCLFFHQLRILVHFPEHIEYCCVFSPIENPNHSLCSLMSIVASFLFAVNSIPFIRTLMSTLSVCTFPLLSLFLDNSLIWIQYTTPFFHYRFLWEKYIL